MRGDRPTGLHRLAERAGCLADVGPKDVAARSSDRQFARYAGRSLCGPVERGDLPLIVHRENTIGDAVQDDRIDRGEIITHRRRLVVVC